MGNEGEASGSRNRPEETERENRPSGSPRRAEASAEAALEEDQEQGNRADLLQRDDRQLPRRGKAEQTGHDADREERGRARQADPLEQGNRSERRQEKSDGESELGEEVGVFGHGGESPTRLPGTPRARLPASALRSGISP